MEEARSILGFDLKYPKDYSLDSITIYDQYIIEISLNSNSCYIRKSKEKGDISGDNNNYSNIATYNIDNTNVVLKGNEKWNLAMWSKGDYSYSIYCNGFTLEEITYLIENIS